VRQWLKFGHSMTAISFLGSVIVLWVMIAQLPPPEGALEVYVAQRQLMAQIASMVMMPSLLISLLFGMASMAAVSGFHSAPWAWAKLVTTVLMLEGSLLGIQSPIKREAALAEKALLDPTHIAGLAQNLSSEQMSLVLIGVVAMANVALGVWRPRFRAKTTAST
jgi:uncharacterized membrane protein